MYMYHVPRTCVPLLLQSAKLSGYAVTDDPLSFTSLRLGHIKILVSTTYMYLLLLFSLYVYIVRLRVHVPVHVHCILHTLEHGRKEDIEKHG